MTRESPCPSRLVLRRLAAAIAAASLLGFGGCRSTSGQADAGHVEFDLAHGLPVVPGARVVYGGTQDDVFVLELATARPAREAAEWYRANLPRMGWREIEVTSAPGKSDSVRLSARRGGSWLLGRMRSDGVETEVTLARGTGPVPSPASILPDEPRAAGSQPASGTAALDGGPPSVDGGEKAAFRPTDVLETLLLPDSVRRVGLPTEHEQTARAGISADLAPPAALSAVSEALKEAGWSVGAVTDGPMPGSRELRATRGSTELRLLLSPSGRGATGMIAAGTAEALDRAFGAPPGRPKAPSPSGRARK